MKKRILSLVLIFTISSVCSGCGLEQARDNGPKSLTDSSKDVKEEAVDEEEENYDDVVDITGFSKVKHLSIAKSKGFKSKRIKINGEFGNFDITDFVLSFKDGAEKSRLYRPDENTMIYIRLMSCDFNEDTKMFEYIRLDCDVFWK